MVINQKIKVTCNTVFYWDIVFKNYQGYEMTYSCVAPNFVKAVNNFVKFMGSADYKFISCTTDGKRYVLH